MVFPNAIQKIVFRSFEWKIQLNKRYRAYLYHIRTSGLILQLFIDLLFDQFIYFFLFFNTVITIKNSKD